MSEDEQNALQKTLHGFLALSSVRVPSQCFTLSCFFSFEQFTFSPLLSPHISTVKLDGFQVWKPTSLRSRGWSSKSPLHSNALQSRKSILLFIRNWVRASLELGIRVSVTACCRMITFPGDEPNWWRWLLPKNIQKQDITIRKTKHAQVTPNLGYCVT